MKYAALLIIMPTVFTLIDAFHVPNIQIQRKSTFKPGIIGISSCAFQRSVPQQHQHRQELNRMTLNQSQNEEDVDVDIDWLVMSLSREQDDATRREKLAELFEGRGLEEGFADAFEKSLENVGTKVQQIAREKADIRELEEGGETGSTKDNLDLPPGVSIDEDGTISLPERTTEELQLWALVDMMVQSKVIMKKMKS